MRLEATSSSPKLAANLSNSCNSSRPARTLSSPEARKIRPVIVSVSLVLLVCGSLIEAVDNSRSRRTSELSLDNLGLSSIPRDQLCSNYSNQSSLDGPPPVNLASFAFNHIGHLEANIFICIAEELRVLILRYNHIGTIDELAFARLDRIQVLLLDNNRLLQVPSVATLAPLKSLRHLNLANNKIDALPAESFAPLSLISLDLRGNPLHQVSSRALVHLSRLKTLTLSQSQLAAKLEPLEGLTELRFLHLDRMANLSSVSPDLCADSPKLATLVLKSNRLEQIPQLKRCEWLLLIDLSYNLIGGTLSGPSLGQDQNLIDLYLGHNQIESIEENAFAGLVRLQVLALNNNRLKWIHPRAFQIQLQPTLYELNVAHNPQLRELPSLGLERLSQLVAFGNDQLRELPHFKSAVSLALTFAYHCCDYQTKSAVSNFELEEQVNSRARESILARLSSFLAGRVERLLRGNSNAQIGGPPDDDTAVAENDTSNLSELVLWPQVPRPTRKEIHVDSIRRQPSGREKRSHKQLSYSRRMLIDELVAQVQQIRRANSNFSISDSVGQQLFSESNESRPDDEYEDSTAELVAKILAGESFGGNHRKRRQNGIPLAAYFQSPASGLDEDELEMRSRWPHWRIDNQPRQSSKPMQVKCLPKPSAFLPCRDLFDTWPLRAGIWCVFLLAFTGNILVIIVLGSVRPSSSSSALTSIMWLAHSKRHIDVPRFLVINLAVADLLMALYLGILASVDLSTLGRFKLFAIKWQFSFGCKLAGFLGVLSSELSVFILAIITLERNYAITNAVHLNRRLSLQKAMLIMFVGYAFALSMAIMPLYGISDYRKFSICLPLDVESNLGSQIYIITLIGINTFSFVLLLSCYLRMYCAIRGSQAWNTNDLKIAKRMSILVVTDFLCWMPIIVVGVASLFGYYLVGTSGLKVLTIFILPLNSVANPFLYAITTKKFKRDLGLLMRRFATVTGITGCGSNTGRQKEPKLFAGAYHSHHHQHHHCLDHPGANQHQFARVVATERRKRSIKSDGHQHHLHASHHQLHHEQKLHQFQIQQQAFSSTAKNARNGRLNGSSSATLKMQIPTGGPTAVHQVSGANQVTMNRTTMVCSCQQPQRARELTYPERLDADLTPAPIEFVRSGEQLHMDDLGRHQQQPRIVLDSVEPAVDAALTSLKISRDSASELASDQFGRLVARVSSGGCESRLVVNDGPCWRQESGFITSPQVRTTTELHAPRSNGANAHLRPHSAEEEITTKLKPAGPHLSCQAILVKNSAGSREGLFNDTCSRLLPGQIENRSASACGYRNSYRRSAKSFFRKREPCCDQSGSKSGSCGAMRAAALARSSEKLSRSINRLLFEPIAKAWSSIQISLYPQQPSVNLTQLVIETGGARATGAADYCGDEHCATCSPHPEPAAPQYSSQEEEADSVLLQQDSTNTVDDILQLSSPARRLMRNNERRMSRSCDLIPALQQQYQQDLQSPSSSANSQFDYSDDRRILLATINSINSARAGKNAGTWQTHIGRPGNLAPLPARKYLKSRCTRCRSWSPALLSKLEDCIYQIRGKIPKRHKTQQQTAAAAEIHEVCHGNNQAADTHRDDDNNIDLSSSDDENYSEDQFDDAAELPTAWVGRESDMKVHVRQKHSALGRQSRVKQRHHQQKQSSSNSDTVSIRTGRTILTNMSVSFDSSTNIPTSTSMTSQSSGGPMDGGPKPDGPNESAKTREEELATRTRQV